MVDPTGLRCDVIGTSFRSWAQAQGRFCDSPPGMCMGNQLGTLRREDEQRLARGHAPKYLVSFSSWQFYAQIANAYLLNYAR